MVLAPFDFLFKRMSRDFEPVNYLNAARSAIENSPLPRITLEEVFDGSLALGPKRKLFPMQEKLIVEIEVCEFLAEWYPEMTVKIIKEVIEKNSQSAKDYKSGEQKALNFLIGQVMQKTNKSADYKIVKEILEKELK